MGLRSVGQGGSKAVCAAWVRSALDARQGLALPVPAHNGRCPPGPVKGRSAGEASMARPSVCRVVSRRVRAGSRGA